MDTAIILAGGLGTRLKSVVPELPKPMAPVNGRPFLEHQLDYWIDQGVSRFILSVGYKRDLIIDHFGECYRSVSLTYAVESEPLGTGGGLLNAIRDLDESFLVLNGDTFFEVDLSNLIKCHEEKNADWTMALFESSNVERYMGVRIDGSGAITELQSKSTAASCLVNGGVYLVAPSILSKTKFLNQKKLSLEDELLPFLKNHGGKLFGSICSGVFIDIGVPEDYFRAPEILLTNKGSE